MALASFFLNLAGLLKDLDAKNFNLLNVKTATYKAEFDNGNSGAAATISFLVAQKQKITLTANCTFTFTAPNGPGNFVLRLIQDGTGGRTVTWPAAVKWVGSAAPTLTTTAAAVDIVTIYYDGTNFNASYGLNFG
jgi:hypothetical protein